MNMRYMFWCCLCSNERYIDMNLYIWLVYIYIYIWICIYNCLLFMPYDLYIFKWSDPIHISVMLWIICMMCITRLKYLNDLDVYMDNAVNKPTTWMLPWIYNYKYVFYCVGRSWVSFILFFTVMPWMIYWCLLWLIRIWYY